MDVIGSFRDNGFADAFLVSLPTELLDHRYRDSRGFLARGFVGQVEGFSDPAADSCIDRRNLASTRRPQP